MKNVKTCTVSLEVSEVETNEVFVQVKGRVYMDYIRSIGTVLAVSTILLNVVYQLFSIGSNIWLSVWSSDTTTVVNGVQDMGKTDMYLAVYGAFGVGQGESYTTVRKARDIDAYVLYRILVSTSVCLVRSTLPTGTVLK